jgi:FtsZ-binding cell division protein ZapB
MMKPLSRRFRPHLQRGAVGPQAPEPSPSLPALMQQLEGLENRLTRLKTGLGHLQQLQLEAEADRGERQSLGVEVNRLQQAVDDFELELATQTLGWQHVQETFWQAVRFGGLGVVLGWGLAWLVQRGG